MPTEDLVLDGNEGVCTLVTCLLIVIVFAVSACDIGVWFYVMLCMVGLSMLTNSFIAFVSSNQMDYWLPSHKDNDV